MLNVEITNIEKSNTKILKALGEFITTIADIKNALDLTEEILKDASIVKEPPVEKPAPVETVVHEEKPKKKKKIYTYSEFMEQVTAWISDRRITTIEAMGILKEFNVSNFHALNETPELIPEIEKRIMEVLK